MEGLLILLLALVIYYWFKRKKKTNLEREVETAKILNQFRGEKKDESQQKIHEDSKQVKFDYNNEYNIDSITKAEMVTNTKVVGVSHDSQTGKDRQDLVIQLESREFLNLIHQKDNPHDPNAIVVINSDGHDIGFLPKNLASKIAPQFNEYDFFGLVNSLRYGPTKGVSIKVLKLPN